MVFIFSFGVCRKFEGVRSKLGPPRAPSVSDSDLQRQLRDQETPTEVRNHNFDSPPEFRREINSPSLPSDGNDGVEVQGPLRLEAQAGKCDNFVHSPLLSRDWGY